MELRHLRYFVAVAEELHFGRAARRVHIAQPPLSQQIRQLEAELGAPLFTRTSHKVSLTAAGDVLLPQARNILERVQSAAESVKRIAEGETGAITIGYVDEAVHFAFPQLLRSFQKLYPGIECVLKELHSSEQMEALHDGSIDLSFGYASDSRPDINRRPVLTGQIELAVPLEHRLANKKKINLESLKDESFIFPVRRHSPYLHDFLMSICNSKGLVPQIKYTAEHIYTVMGLVRSGMGLTFFPNFLGQGEWPGVRILPLSGTAYSMSLWISWRKDREECILIKRFLDLLSETFPKTV